jgi:protein ImuB
MSPFGCVLVEHFHAAAAERCEPALREQPLAVVDTRVERPMVGRERAATAKRNAAPTANQPSVATATTMMIVEANAEARAQGVRPGMTETEARARCPTLVVRLSIEEHVLSARHALLEAALTVSPRIEDAAAGLVYVDTVGLERLIGDPPSIGRRLVQQARAVGLIARIGLAASRTAARVAAANASGPVMVIAPGRERAALARAPVTALDLSPDLAATLARWGVRTVGELAALPREGLATRLGAAGLRAHDLALGLDHDPFRPWTPPPFWEEAQGLEWEIDSLGALALVLETLLERLCRRLAAMALAADALEIRLGLASGGHHARDVSLAYPVGDVKPMLTLVVLDLEAHPPQAPVTRVAVSAHPIRTQAGQGGLWQPPAPAARDLVSVLARLAALVGADKLGSPALVDSHRADAFTMLTFSPPAEPEADPRRRWRSPRADPPTDGDAHALAARAVPDACGHRLALRRMRPARRVDVEAAGERPTRVGGYPVLACAGPWHASGEWWDTGAWAREEWDVMLGDGALCRVVRDRFTGHWYLDALYD